MNYINNLVIKKVKKDNTKKKIVFPEGDDPRVIEAVKKLVKSDKPIIPILLTDKPISLEGIENITIDSFDDKELIDLFVEKRLGKISKIDATALIKNKNYFATLLLESGRCDGLVGGCIFSTTDILRPAFQIIKTKPGYSIVSSSFLMIKDEKVLLFGDCAVNIVPSENELVDIAKATAETAVFLEINDPKIAMLSFSTHGSGKHELSDKISRATERAKKLIPTVKIDGEIQFDAAFVPSVGIQKAPNSIVAGHANIYIFPNLESGNIGYKIAQRLGGYEAVGPILQGLNKPMSDLSRGCNADDIFQTALIVYLQI